MTLVITYKRSVDCGDYYEDRDYYVFVKSTWTNANVKLAYDSLKNEIDKIVSSYNNAVWPDKYVMSLDRSYATSLKRADAMKTLGVPGYETEDEESSNILAKLNAAKAENEKHRRVIREKIQLGSKFEEFEDLHVWRLINLNSGDEAIAESFEVITLEELGERLSGDVLRSE